MAMLVECYVVGTFSRRQMGRCAANKRWRYKNKRS